MGEPDPPNDFYAVEIKTERRSTMPNKSTPAVTHTLSAAQAKHIEFYNGYNVPVQWFVGAERDNGDVEVIALGAYDLSDPDDDRQFIWSLLINADGSECHTSEAEIPEGFSTGIEI